MTKEEKTIAMIGLVWTFAACVLLVYLFHKIRKSLHDRDRKRALLKLRAETLLIDPRVPQKDKEFIAKDHCYLYPFSPQCKGFEVSWWRLHKYDVGAVSFGFLSASIGIFLLTKNPPVAAAMIIIGILTAVFGGSILYEINKGGAYKVYEEKIKMFQEYFEPTETLPEVEGLGGVMKIIKPTIETPEGIIIEV